MMGLDNIGQENESITPPSLTSRSALMDYVSVVIQLLCANNHCMEAYIGVLEKSAECDLTEAKRRELEGKKVALWSQIELGTQLRRTIMRHIEDRFGTEQVYHEVWCSFKHIAEAMGTMQDSVLGDKQTPLEKRSVLIQMAFELFIGALSLWLGTPYTNCLRCLEDRIAKEEKEKDESTKEQIKKEENG